MYVCMCVPRPQGLLEMRAFSKALYPTVRDETFLECCGIGDLVATCYGGRNRLVAQEWTKRVVVSLTSQLVAPGGDEWCMLACGKGGGAGGAAGASRPHVHTDHNARCIAWVRYVGVHGGSTTPSSGCVMCGLWPGLVMSFPVLLCLPA